MTTIWQQINHSAAQVVDTVRESLVQIVSDAGGIGAGTIWQADGLVITNAHVIMGREERRNLRVLLHNGESYPATVIAYDRKRDIAALAIDAQNLPAIQPGNSSQLVNGQYVMAIGHPWGVLDAVTGGVVITTGDTLPELSGEQAWIALDMKMRPGHSGGALFNSMGQLVGVNTMIMGHEVSLAIPVDDVKAFLKQVFAHPNMQPQVASDAPQTPAPTIV